MHLCPLLPQSQSPVSTAAVQTLCANMQLRLSERRPPVVAVAAGGCGGGSLQQKQPAAGGRDNPLTVVLAWMNARDKHLQRYHDLYLGLGFDVLTVRTLPLQLAFPASGAQVVARKLLEFLLSHPNYSRLVVHGFSVGGYQFGEVLVQMRKQQDRYAALLPRFKAQWLIPPDPIIIPYDERMRLARIYKFTDDVNGVRGAISHVTRVAARFMQLGPVKWDITFHRAQCFEEVLMPEPRSWEQGARSSGLHRGGISWM
ncbi:hypothetical protein HPB48_008720 [Haemaphysalis longicornis]|uniref:Uncharacterized protein n=1 Tax=Haemaphysalis longicornis TaxID=44386 RepID=A0A9J6GAX4_HAELO|nr:hypothetical protein HPB48_008720 [Haemaphysalis longicornis]